MTTKTARPLGVRRMSAVIFVALLRGADVGAWEFVETSTKARLENPQQEYLWWTGDQDGDGASDRHEQFGRSMEMRADVGAVGVSAASADLAPGGEGFGSVSIVFNDPVGLVNGFLAVDGGSGELDGDGSADDIDESVQHGPDGFDSITPAWEPDARIVGLAGDVGDLVRLPTTWNSVQGASRQRWRSALVARSLRFVESDKVGAIKFRQRLEIDLGARFVGLPSELTVNAFGGVLGDSFWESSVANQTVGPTIGLAWGASVGKFSLEAGASGMMGYRMSNVDVSAGFGTDRITGQFNHPLWFQSTRSNSSTTTTVTGHSPVGEANVRLDYAATKNVVLFVGGDAIYQTSVVDARDTIDYSLSRIGFRDGGTVEYYMLTAFGGVEWRR